MTVIESKAKDIEGAAFILGHFLGTTNADKLNWEPKAEGEESKSRSAFDMVKECIEVNHMMAAMLRGQEMPADQAAVTSVEDGKQRLMESASVAAAALREQDDSVFEKTFQAPWGPITGDFLITISMANMHYHCGQVNYIQRLYGDDVFHAPRA